MTLALKYNLKSGSLIPPALLFFLKTTLAIQGLLCFHMKCEIFCSSSVKNAIGSLIGIALNLSITLGGLFVCLFVYCRSLLRTFIFLSSLNWLRSMQLY